MIMATGQGMSPLVSMLPILAIFAVFYFIVIVPHKKQQQKKQAMITALKKGDRVITSGGVYGTVVTVEDQSLMLKVAENTKIRVAKSAIAGPVEGDGKTVES